jgi:hypothetical protein
MKLDLSARCDWKVTLVLSILAFSVGVLFADYYQPFKWREAYEEGFRSGKIIGGAPPPWWTGPVQEPGEVVKRLNSEQGDRRAK